MKIMIEIQPRTIRIKNDHQPRNTASRERAPLTTSKPIYHSALWSLTKYSSACQEIDCGVFAISLL